MKEVEFGSAAWIAQVMSSAPARNVRGRSRPTQRYIVEGLDGNPDVAEGGNAAVARSLLTSAALAGQVNQLKMEPFKLRKSAHGVDGIPDVLFVTSDGKTYVAEAKSARYLTEEKIEKCRKVERVINQAGMTYLFWTDEWPLTPAVWRLAREMRRCGGSNTTEASAREIQALIAGQPLTFRELREAGHYREFVLAATWGGYAHFDLFADINDDTLVSSDRSTRGFESLLTAPVSAQSWWKTLKRTQKERNSA